MPSLAWVLAVPFPPFPPCLSTLASNVGRSSWRTLGRVSKTTFRHGSTNIGIADSSVANWHPPLHSSTSISYMPHTQPESAHRFRRAALSSWRQGRALLPTRRDRALRHHEPHAPVRQSDCLSGRLQSQKGVDMTPYVFTGVAILRTACSTARPVCPVFGQAEHQTSCTCATNQGAISAW